MEKKAVKNMKKLPVKNVKKKSEKCEKLVFCFFHRAKNRLPPGRRNQKFTNASPIFSLFPPAPAGDLARPTADRRRPTPAAIPPPPPTQIRPSQPAVPATVPQEQPKKQKSQESRPHPNTFGSGRNAQRLDSAASPKLHPRLLIWERADVARSQLPGADSSLKTHRT